MNQMNNGGRIVNEYGAYKETKNIIWVVVVECWVYIVSERGIVKRVPISCVVEGGYAR